MPIDKKLIRFKQKSNFLSQENGVNNNPSEVTSGSEIDGTAVYGNLRGRSIVFIEDSKEIWTHGNLYKSVNWDVLGNTGDNSGGISSGESDNIVYYDLTNANPEESFSIFAYAKELKIFDGNTYMIFGYPQICAFVTIGGAEELSNQMVAMVVDYNALVMMSENETTTLLQFKSELDALFPQITREQFYSFN